MQDTRYMSLTQLAGLKIRTFLHVTKLESKYRIEVRRNKSEGSFYALVDLNPGNGQSTKMIGKSYNLAEIVVALNQVNPKAAEIWKSIPLGAEPSDYDEKPKKTEQQINMEVGQRLRKIEPKLATGIRKTLKNEVFIMTGASNVASDIALCADVEREIRTELHKLIDMNQDLVEKRCNLLLEEVIQSSQIKNRLHMGRINYQDSNHNVDITIMATDIFKIRARVTPMIQKLQKDTGKSYEDIKSYITVL